MNNEQLDEAILKAYQKVWPSDETTAVSVNFREFARRLLAEVQKTQEPAAWMYTLEYGNTIADTKVSTVQLNYPFGVAGADYLRSNHEGISYVRQTPLYKALEIK